MTQPFPQGGYQPGPPQPPPPNSSARTILLVLGSSVVFLLGLSCLVGAWRTDAPAPAHADPPVQPTPRNIELRGIALYKSRIGFGVCVRQPLHGCSLWFGGGSAGDQFTIRSRETLDFGAVESCEGLAANALAACTDAGTGLFQGTGPISDSWRQCLLRNGLFYRGSESVTAVDPRDEDRRLAPGELRLECQEGYKTGHFDDTL